MMRLDLSGTRPSEASSSELADAMGAEHNPRAVQRLRNRRGALRP
jgi:hypothetical protein